MDPIVADPAAFLAASASAIRVRCITVPSVPSQFGVREMSPTRNLKLRFVVYIPVACFTTQRPSRLCCTGTARSDVLWKEPKQMSTHPELRHPELFALSVRCSTCGNEFTTRSTKSELVVDVCSQCHPAYTGRERAVASGSRIERFERRRARSAAAVVAG